MYSFENYLNEDLLSEDLLNEDLLDSFDESFDEAKRATRPNIRGMIRPGVRPRVAQQSNFGRNLTGSAADYATKSDLKKALDGISNDVNELKKTSISTSKALALLDEKHTELAKIEARKSENQTKVLKNMQMMSMMSSLLVQPKLLPENLQVVQDSVDKAKYSIQTVSGKNPIEIDQTMSLMLPLLTTMGDSGSGKSSDNSSIMLPLVLMMSSNKSGSDNNMLPLVLMMTMMNK